MSGRLWLIPVPLGEVSPLASLPAATLEAARRLEYFVAESARSARAFLKAIGPPLPLQEIAIEEIPRELDEPTADRLLAPLRAGRDGGLLSEAGAPAVADPGASLIARAHALGVPIVPCVGPSSVLLALMASGLEGQRFAFHGYLPIERAALGEALKRLEQDSAREDRTQIWIEAPYRNDRMREAALEALQPQTRLAVACELTLAGEWLRTASVAEWRRAPGPSLDRRPAVFLLQAAPGPADRARPRLTTPGPADRARDRVAAPRPARRVR
jgi:16S rRNA (cytidine1402-2'-O)-methyltransferase